MNRQKKIFAFVCIAPVVLFVVSFIIYPVVDLFRLSMTDKVLTDPGSGGFVGLASYVRVFSDNVTFLALKNTLVYVGGGVALTLVLGLIAGLVLSEDSLMTKITTGLILIPWALPPVIIASVWKWMLHPQLGVINDLLVKTGILASPVPFLSKPGTALYVLTIVLAWRLFPFEGIMLAAGMKGIPIERYEAALVDGANGFQRFRFITLPGIKSLILTTTIMNTVWILNSIALVLIMTGGGPLHYTELLSTLIYKTGFQHYRFGEASALSVLNFLIILALTMMYLRLFRDRSKHMIAAKAGGAR